MEPHNLAGYLRLLLSPLLGSARLAALLTQFGGIEPLLTLPGKALIQAGLQEDFSDRLLAARADQNMAGQISVHLDWQEIPDHSIVCYEDSSYPESLRHIPSPPPLLFVIGQVSLLNKPQLAIVGSRRASQAGSRTAFWFARELGNAGLVICSGLALGIDSRAHEGALAGEQSTIAVMGTGPDRIYPENNLRLADAIKLDGGVLLTEFPLGVPPARENFPRRNRIIAGLGLGTLVVEATRRSGSLITARLAAEQGREVFAVPGPISNQGSRGCHELIRQGATLVEDPGDILEEINGFYCPAVGSRDPLADAPGSGCLTSLQERILDSMGDEACLLDSLLRDTGLGLEQLSGELVVLEIQGLISSVGGRYIKQRGTLA